MSKPARVAFLSLLLLALSGCAIVSEEGRTKTFTYDPNIPVVMVLVALAAGLIGWKIRKAYPPRSKSFRDEFFSTAYFGGKLMVAGVLVVLLAPGYYLVRTTVTDEGFTAAGFYGRVKCEAKFDDITHAQLTAQGDKNAHYWTFSRRSAEDVKLSIGDEVSEQAANEIVARLKARGIETEEGPGNQ